jgi:hypothetical protein
MRQEVLILQSYETLMIASLSSVLNWNLRAFAIGASLNAFHLER